MSTPIKHVSIRIPNDLHARVVDSAEGDRRSLNAQILTLIEEALKARDTAVKSR